MPDIEALTSQVQQLEESYGCWNNITLWLVAGTAVVATLYFVSSYITNNVGNRLKNAQSVLIRAKEEQLTLDLRAKDEQIAVAKEEAAKAIERAAQAGERAAEANQKAEEEKLARVKIEKQLAPRVLSESDLETIGKELRSFAAHFSGRKAKVMSYSQDAEGIVFALMIQDILTRAGIETESAIGRGVPIGLVDIGVKISGPIEDKDFMLGLANGVRSRLDTRLNVEWNSEHTELTIKVGVKPVAGLPEIVRDTTPPKQ